MNDVEIWQKSVDFVRKERNRLLSENVDILNGAYWDSLDTNKKELWKKYRQDLLDITSQEGFPFNVIWPTQP